MFKFIFAFLLLIVCSTYGFYKSFKLKSRLKNLTEIKNALRILESCIRFTYTDISKAFLEAHKLSDTSGIFKSVSDNIKEMGASKAWQFSINKNASQLCLNKEDIHTLSLLGAKLGMTDENEQVKTIECVMNMLDIHITSARYECQKYCRLYSSGGILTGAFLCLVLV